METDGTPLHVLVVESAVGKVCFFPDGSHLLTSEVLGAKVWDARTYKKVSTLDMDEESPGAIDLSANGRLIAVEGWTTHHVRVYSARDGRLRCFLRGQRQEIKALAISPDSKLAVGGSRTPDKRLRVWEARGGPGRS
jgi:WD40 repeat protein